MVFIIFSRSSLASKRRWNTRRRKSASRSSVSNAKLVRCGATYTGRYDADHQLLLIVAHMNMILVPMLIPFFMFFTYELQFQHYEKKLDLRFSYT